MPTFPSRRFDWLYAAPGFLFLVAVSIAMGLAIVGLVLAIVFTVFG